MPMHSARVADTSKVSVVICSYDRAQSLHAALVSLGSMRVPADLGWEIIVVDNNSTDDTRNVVADFAKNTLIRVRYVFEGKQGLNHARNAGIRAAIGDFIFFVDDDVQVSEDWLLELKKAFEEHDVAGVGGRVLLKQDVVRPKWWKAEYDGALGRFDNGTSRILSDPSYHSIVGIGANLAFKRSVFEKYGLFHPSLDRRGAKLSMGGDIEYTDRLKAAGELLMYYPSAVVYQCPDAARITRSYLRRWYFRIGEWEAVRVVPERKQASTILTTPRWKYGKMLDHFWRTVSLTLRGQHGEGFHQQLQFISHLGYLFGAAKTSVTGRLPVW